MKWIIFREWTNFFRNPMVFGIFVLCSFLMSLSFFNSLSVFATRLAASQVGGAMDPSQGPLFNIHYQVFINHLSLTHLILLFFIPVLVTKLIPEERKKGSFSLLLVSPLRHYEIVYAYYLSLLTFVAFLLLLSFIYPLMTASVAHFLWSPLIMAYLGIFFISSVYISLSLYSGTLIESPFGSVLFSFFLNVLFVTLLSQIVNLTDDPSWKESLRWFTPAEHLNVFIKGAFRLSSVVYFLSITLVFLFLSIQNLDFIKWKGR